MDPYERFAQRANRDHADRIERLRDGVDGASLSRRSWGYRATLASAVDARQLHAQCCELARKGGAIDGWHLATIPVLEFRDRFGVPLHPNVNYTCACLRSFLKPFDTPAQTLWIRYWYRNETPWHRGYPLVPGETFIAVALKPSRRDSPCARQPVDCTRSETAQSPDK